MLSREYRRRGGRRERRGMIMGSRRRWTRCLMMRYRWRTAFFVAGPRAGVLILLLRLLRRASSSKSKRRIRHRRLDGSKRGHLGARPFFLPSRLSKSLQSRNWLTSWIVTRPNVLHGESCKEGILSRQMIHPLSPGVRLRQNRIRNSAEATSPCIAP